jgi:hypothetical protein
VRWGGAISPKVLAALERVLEEGSTVTGGDALYTILAAAATGTDVLCTQLSHGAPQPAHVPPASHATVLCRVPPSGRVP